MLEQILTEEIITKLSEFDKLGGVIDYKIFKKIGTSLKIDAHLKIAQETLRLLDPISILSINDGKEITPEFFFGPYFNFKKQRPILREKKGTKTEGSKVIAYVHDYYYDDPEIDSNRITIKNINEEYITQGYTDAFLRPPYGFGRNGMSNLEIGRFFLDFNKLLFDDITTMDVFSWPTDSIIFDDGKEWWGSFFWTVYNPNKDWYIGITVSSTD